MELDNIKNIEEIWYYVLLYSNSVEFNILLKESPVAKRLCHSKLFWVDKFNYDDLFIFGSEVFQSLKSCQEWLDEYNRIINAKAKAKAEVTLIKNKIKLKDFFYIYWDIDDLSPINQFIVNKIYYADDPNGRNVATLLRDESLIQSIQLIYEYDEYADKDLLTIAHVYRQGNNIVVFNDYASIDYDTLYDLIMHIYYYYPQQETLVQKLKALHF